MIDRPAANTELPQPWVSTPLVESAALSRAAGCRIFLKFENMQPSGSFKSRGLGYMIRAKVAEAQKAAASSAATTDAPKAPAHFYCSSGGNAGVAAVTAARQLNHPATVVVPVLTKPAMIARIRAAGATDVIQTGASWREADDYLRTELLAKDPGGVYLPPFEHELVYEGNAGIVDELIDDMPANTDLEPDAIVCSVGGGGLFCGIARGVARQYGGRPRVLAVETEGCDSLAQSLAAGHRITLPRITSLATSLGATQVGPVAFELAANGTGPYDEKDDGSASGKEFSSGKNNVHSVVVSDGDAARACLRFADDERVLVELSCGASLCVAYDRLDLLRAAVPEFGPQSKVVLVVCGGANVSLAILNEYREMFGEKTG